MFWNIHKGSSGKSPVALENQIKQLQLNIITLSDQLENFKRICRKYQEEYNRLVKRVNEFCRMILETEYVRNQLGGNNPLSDMDIFTLLNYAEQCYRNNNIKERNLIIELTDKLKEKEQEIEGLKAQISRYMLREQQLKEELNAFDEQQSVASSTDSKSTSVEENIHNVSSTPSTLSSATKTVSSERSGIMKISIIEDDEDEETDNFDILDDEQHKNLKYDEEKRLKTCRTSCNIVPQPADSTAKNKDVIAHVIDLKEYINKINDIMWEIIIAIGKKGLSESKDLKKEVVKRGITESSFNTALSQLRKMNIVEQEKFNTGWRWFYAYELSDLGRQIYVERFGSEPVLCEKQILQKEHTTALHGYCIKDAAYILKSVFGYDEAVTDRKMNSMKLYNGEVYIPDIIAKKRQGAITDYFEVELGHHTQKDFNSKCDKMRMVTKNLYFITPDADTMNKILVRQISQWVLEKGGKDKLKGLTIYLTTMTKLSEGRWDNIYRF